MIYSLPILYRDVIITRTVHVVVSNLNCFHHKSEEKIVDNNRYILCDLTLTIVFCFIDKRLSSLMSLTFFVSNYRIVDDV